MKLLVFAHRLELGGTQINAIELAAQLRDAHGMDVVVHATPGPALPVLKARGLAFIPAPDARFHPSPHRMRELRRVAKEVKPDLVHAWDWWQGLEAYLGLHLVSGVPLVITDMMMSLTHAMPRKIPTTFGFRDLLTQARRAGWTKAELLLPPVDVTANAPGVVDGQSFRERVGVGADELLLVSVSRLATVMKSESLVRTIRVLRDLGQTLPLKLAVVGDGEARPQLQALADEVNGYLGRDAVVLVGAMEDPRPAYAAADILLGMGGSSLRGLAHAKPVIVLGENGFARVFSPRSSPLFLRTGMYGHGDGDDHALSSAIRELAVDADLRAELGEFGRHFVVSHHGLEPVAEGFARFCRQAAEARAAPVTRAWDTARLSYWYLRQRRFRVASRDEIVPPVPQHFDADPLRP